MNIVHRDMNTSHTQALIKDQRKVHREAAAVVLRN